MRRHIDEELAAWSVQANRKPLLLFGARQVGKTYALKKLGAQQYDNVVHLDFSRDVRAADLFEGSIDPHELVSGIEALLRVRIQPKTTLLILDEIQLSERALTSLKYFYEDAPEYHVTAAGSLLGVKIRHERYSFPVGKVDIKTLHPLDFEEFLWARSEAPLAELIKESASSLPQEAKSFALHDRACELIHTYFLVGGMPEAVEAFATQRDRDRAGVLDRVRAIQQQIDQAYVADMTKYSTAAEAPRIFEAWRSVPNQLAKENHKFQYAQVRSGGRANQYETALAWLEAAGIVTRCTQVGEGVAPLRSFEHPDVFKIYLADTGILAAAYNAVPANLAPSADKASQFRGGIAENYVLQQLVAHSSTPYYWGTTSRSEVEFLATDKQGDVIPIEVKSGANVRANSLMSYREKYRPAYVVRMSTRNYGFEGGILSMPLYAACFFARERLL